MTEIPSTTQCCDCADDSELRRCLECHARQLKKIEGGQENVLTLAESAWANRHDPIRFLNALAALMEETGAWVEDRKKIWKIVTTIRTLQNGGAA